MKVSLRLVSWSIPLMLAASCTAQQVAPVSFAFPDAALTGSSVDVPAPPASMMVSSASNVPVSSPAAQPSLWPRPYLFGGLALNRGGYAPSAGTFGGGVETETKHFLGLAETWFEDAPKQDLGNGNEFGVRARGFLRTSRGWYFGGGAQWSKLDTTSYTKQAWRPAFGGGKDVSLENFSMRAQVLYVLPGTDHLNELQGPEISLWLPSPASRSHLFYRQTLGIYGFHQTAVPTSDRQMASFLDFTMMYRF